uniref:TLC domain containing 1 n=1 Tax=Amazona collaria TaxID=241587 RepID=A0A8B9G5M6_9PSIT
MDAQRLPRTCCAGPARTPRAPHTCATPDPHVYNASHRDSTTITYYSSRNTRNTPSRCTHNRSALHTCAEPPPYTHVRASRTPAPAQTGGRGQWGGVATRGVANEVVWSLGRRGERGGVVNGEAWSGERRGQWGRGQPAAPPEQGAMGPGWRAPSAALVAGSVAIFAGLRRVALALPRPAAVRNRPGRAWRWLNLLVSFAHSVLAGLWALFSLWHAPELLSDIQDGYSVSGHLLVCFSSGYFIHDTLDIIFNHQSRSSWEYLVHHAMAISAFVSLIITGRFLVAAMLLLLVEVSNIFLTIRMLLKMSNVPSPALYEANKYVNLVMYFAFRLAPQAYLTWYFLRYVEVQGQGAFLTANLLLLDAMILMYFSRLLRSDFFPSLRKGSAGRDVDGEKFLID